MNSLKSLSQIFLRKAENLLKDYRQEADPAAVEQALEKALQEFSYEDVEVLFNNQHYGWFVWDWDNQKHIQKNINDFQSEDTIDDLRDFAGSLTKINLNNYL